MKNNRIRVGIIITKEDKILLVKMHRENSKDIYVLPGGGVDKGEDIFDAAVREVKEETNLNVNIKKILYLKDLYTDKETSIEIILLGEIIGGLLKKGFDPEEKGKNILKEVKYVPISEFKNLNFHPKQLRDRLEKDFRNNFVHGTINLGNFRYPEE